MRFIKNILYTILAVSFLAACNDDDVDFSFEELRNDDFDLAVVTDAQPYVEAAFSVSGNLESISATITQDGSTEPVGTQTISNFTGSSFTRINIEIPFPTPNLAPSGLYTIDYTITTTGGEQSGGSYQISVVNNRPPAFCPVTESLPVGTNTWIRLYVPTATQLADGEIIYATGSFEGWSGGGNSTYAFTKVSETCYQLAVQLPTDAEVKFTRGGWSSEAQDFNKNNFSNLQTAGRTSIEVSIFDWSDTDLDLAGIDPPSSGNEIPSDAVQPGKLTVIASITGSDVNEGMYYMIAEGETDITNGVLMTPYENENRLAAAVPKDASASYVVVQNDIATVGTNAYGFAVAAAWDGETNPTEIFVGSFDGGSELPDNIYMTGSATDGWAGGASFPIPKVSDGVYEATFTINGDSEYLLLPAPGDFGNKWAYGSGDASAGTFDAQGNGPNLNTNGLATGSYTITVDFTSGLGSYTLVAQ